LLSIPDGKRTLLKVGPPYTTSCTGHEAWIGASGEILLSVMASGEFAAEKGSLLAIRPGGVHRVVARGHIFNHVGVSRCGRLYCVDDSYGQVEIVLGSPRTGRSTVAFASKTVLSFESKTHAHPYLTPDLKWVIFNSTRSGWPHIYAARIPEDIVSKLLAS
jgi:hypothetical protein